MISCVDGALIITCISSQKGSFFIFKSSIRFLSSRILSRCRCSWRKFHPRSYCCLKNKTNRNICKKNTKDMQGNPINVVYVVGGVSSFFLRIEGKCSLALFALTNITSYICIEYCTTLYFTEFYHKISFLNVGAFIKCFPHYFMFCAFYLTIFMFSIMDNFTL